MLDDLFSKRNKEKPTKLRYDLPELVRSRILNTLDHIIAGAYGESGMFGYLLIDVCKMCYLAYGGLIKKKNKGFVTTSNPADDALEHFLACDDEKALDFIELCFQSGHYRAEQGGVDAVNEVLREEAIGYEFSPYVTRFVKKDGRGEYQVTYPQAIAKTDEVLHSHAIMPALTVLTDLRFQSANSELLEAHKHFRDGNSEAAIWSAGRALESTLKTICTEKKWAYNPDKDALSKLVEACRGQNLFEPFFAPILIDAGTIRNKMGGHGKGPDMVTPTPEYAEHMLNLVSSHILLLVRLAKL